MTDFAGTFRSLEEFMKSAGNGLLNSIDQFTFKMLIDCLKSSDYQVVVDAIDQLAKEKRQIAIPPLYFVAKAHGNQAIRERAAKAVQDLDPKGEAQKLAADKPLKEAIQCMLTHYGHYRA